MTVNELRRVAALLRTLAEAENARIEGDDARVVSLLDSVDPHEARTLAGGLHFDAGVRRVYLNVFRDEVAARVSSRTPW